VHEWAHLAVDAGWVPCNVGDAELAARHRDLEQQLAATIQGLLPPARAMVAGDLAALAEGGSPAARLVGIFVARRADFQSNLLARRFLAVDEVETYVRHNVRTLRPSYAPSQLLRMLVRYLHEYQYLAFSRISDPRTYFVRSTWFDADFFVTGVVDPDRFAALASAAARVNAAYAVDESRFRTPPAA
jgi:hypothetical protein